MTFFARPDLSNQQFKQLNGSVLTLSGTTQIATVTGLTLSNGSGNYIPIGADNDSGTPTHGMVLGFDSVKNRIRLMDISGGTGTGVYLGLSPTTTTVGGLDENTDIYGSGFTTILERILVPTVEPIVIEPSQTFNISPSTTVFEVGHIFNTTSTTNFCRGSVTPEYDSGGTCVSSSSPRSGIPFEYVYSGTLEGTTKTFNFTGSTRNRKITPEPRIGLGNNSWISCVRYYSGETVYDSSGGEFMNGLTSGHTQSSRNFNGIFPYYWGKWATTTSTPAGASRPSNADIESCINCLNELRATSPSTQTEWICNGNTTCIVVASSSGDINVNWDSNSEDYIWFAVHESNPLKTCWFVNESNRGLIGGAVTPGGNLFPSPDDTNNLESMKWDVVLTNPSSSGCQTFKLYVSNYQSSFVSSMQIRNS